MFIILRKEMPKRKTQSSESQPYQPRKRAGKQPPLLEPPSAPSTTDYPEVQMNLAPELPQSIPGPSYTLGAQETPPVEPLPPHQLQDLAERISTILKDRGSPQSQEEGTSQSGSELSNARVASYDNELGHNVSNNVKIKIANGEYVNLASLINNRTETDPNDDTKYFSLQNGSLALSAKSKLRPITDIQVWTDAFLVYASIFALAHPTETSGLFKYIHTIRLGANRVNGLGWRDYDIQFRLKKECNPSMSFAIVDQELWLLYMYNSAPSPQHLVNQPQPLKCYNFNYRGACSRQNCLYSHLCILCSQPHPYTMCRNNTRNSLNFRSGNFQSTWRPQSTVKPATNSNRIPLPLHARRQ